MKIAAKTNVNQFKGLVKKEAPKSEKEITDKVSLGETKEKEPFVNATDIKDFMKNRTNNAIDFWVEHPCISAGTAGGYVAGMVSAMQFKTGIALGVGLATATVIGAPGLWLNKIAGEKDHSLSKEGISGFVANHPTASAAISGGIVGEAVNICGFGPFWALGTGAATAAVVGGTGYLMHKMGEAAN